MSDFGREPDLRPQHITLSRTQLENAIRECVIELGVKRGYMWHTLEGQGSVVPEDFLLQIVKPLTDKLFK